MKYIKSFETLLKHSDPKVLNHIFKPFAEKLKNILSKLKESDNLDKSSVRLYFDDSGEISIIYRYKFLKVLKIRLLIYHRSTGIELCIMINKGNNFYDNINSDNSTLDIIISSIIKKYEMLNDSSYIYTNLHFIKIDDPTDLSILDNIIKEIEKELDLYLNTKKFNI